jgi:hypothetical protein
VRAEHRFVIQRTAEGLGPGYIVAFEERTRGRDERDATSARESRRTNERF